MGDLERDTELTSEGAGCFTATLSRDWDIWGPNGGYLASIALRAAGQVARVKRPVSLHVHYLRRAQFAPVRVRTSVVQAGRTAESISVLMEQDDKPVLTGLVRTALPSAGLEHTDLAMPEVLPPLEAPDSETLRKPHHVRFPFWQNLERRVLQPESWLQPRTPRAPHWLEWYRYRSPLASQDVFLECARSVVLIDTLCWPAAWLLHGDERFIAPSLDLTVWFHQSDASEWLLADAHAPIAGAGLVSGGCRIWSQSGKLLASGGSQLLCMPSSRP